MRFLSGLPALLLLAAPVAAETPQRPWSPEDTQEWEQAERYAAEGAEKLMRSFEMLLKAMPYGLPRTDEEGNIVIPRQHPHTLAPDRQDSGRT